MVGGGDAVNLDLDPETYSKSSWRLVEGVPLAGTAMATFARMGLDQ